MESKYNVLKEISSEIDTWIIKVRLLRLWHAVNSRNNNDLISLDMIFVDEDQTLIHAIVRKYHVNQFRSKLKEDAIYMIKNVKVLPYTTNFRPVSDFKIIFLTSTTVIEIKNEITKIPQHRFDFADTVTIALRCNSNIYLTDVIGSLISYGSIGEVSSKGLILKKRDIELLIEDEKVLITLWGHHSKDIEYLIPDLKSGPYILILTSTTVKKYAGRFQLSTTNSTKIHVNLEIPETANLLKRYIAQPSEVIQLTSRNATNVLPEKQMFLNRMTLLQIINAKWNIDTQERILTTKASIKEVENIFGWYYISCAICWKKLTTKENEYWCTHCNKKSAFPTPRYKIHLKVTDGINKTTFVLFDREAEKLLNISAVDLLAILDDDIRYTPKQIEQLCGKTFIFQIKLTDYNLKEGVENYSISKTFVPNEELEAEHSLQNMQHELSTCENQSNKSKESDHITFVNTRDKKEIQNNIQQKKETNLLIDDKDIRMAEQHLNELKSSKFDDSKKDIINEEEGSIPNSDMELPRRSTRKRRRKFIDSDNQED